MGSRIQTAIEQLERGESMDLSRILVLQTLDAIRSGEVFVEESLARQEAADAGIAG